MRSWHIEAVGAVAVLTVIAGLTVSPARAESGPLDSVPIAGSVPVSNMYADSRNPYLKEERIQSPDAPQVILALHAVRRVQQATVVYFSFTVSPDVSAKNSGIPVAGYVVSNSAARNTSYGPDYNSDGAIVDTKNRKLYRPFSDGQECLLCSHDFGLSFTDMKPGQSLVGWFSTPAVPAGVSRVDVSVNNRIFHNVPVSDGPLTPAIDEDTIRNQWWSGIPLGVGWPKIDMARLSGVDAKKSVSPLIMTMGDVSNAKRERAVEESTKIDLDSEVLV